MIVCLSFFRPRDERHDFFFLTGRFRTVPLTITKFKVRFSEEERALLRDPENCRRFRREIEAELHVRLPGIHSRKSHNR